MPLKNFINHIINYGIKDEYEPWEIYLTRKINSIGVLGFINALIGLIFFLGFGYYHFVSDCIVVICCGPSVILLNKFKNYVWASYSFYLISFLFFLSMNLKMGRDSLFILFYFPMIITMVQTLGRKEMFKHFVVISALFLISIILLVIGYHNHFMELSFSLQTSSTLSTFNIILSFFATIVFILITVSESLNQERLIKKMLQEKEILLAEVFHRVKNNMNIVTSLLSLKKGMSDSLEVQNALEDCRSRVYSMALVHQKMFNKNNIVGLDFKDYIISLSKDVIQSFGGKDDVELIIEADDVNLELTKAIPCGLILNELITNSFKYYDGKSKKLKITIILMQSSGVIVLTVRDNGPGLPENAFQKSNSLGIELIKSLADQIDARCEFINDNGLVFRMLCKN